MADETARRLMRVLPAAACAALLAGCGTAGRAPAGADDEANRAPVSYHQEVLPLLKANCIGCHCPAKKEGRLMLTTYKAFHIGGKKGPAFVAGDAKGSRVVQMIFGEKPEMPKNAPPLKPDEVALIARWIRQGAKNDSPPPKPIPTMAKPPVYIAPPVISALAWSPDGKTLAVSGYHEVLIHKTDFAVPAAGADPAPVARLVGQSSRVQSLAFSLDGKLLAVGGGVPTEFGEVQVWDTAAYAQLKSYQVTADTVYGVSFSPDATRVAFGGADKTARIIAIEDGQERMRLDNHSDWVLGTTFTMDGKRLVSAGRDRAMKLTDVVTGQFIDDINKLLEPALCLARHPKGDFVAYGGAMGVPRVYKISDNQGRTAANNDTNLVKELERQPAAVQAIAYGPDGETVAVGGAWPEVRLYRIKDGTRVTTLSDHGGAVFAVAFDPEGKRVATGGFEGLVRVFDAATGKLQRSFVPVPIQSAAGATPPATKAPPGGG